MTRLEDLVRVSGPDGVRFMPLKEIIDFERPGKYRVSSAIYSAESNTPVLTAGKTFVLGYTDEIDGIYPASPDTPVIIFDDFTTAIQWVDFPFKVKSAAMKILRLRAEAPAALRFVWYAMKTIRYCPRDHALQWISRYADFRIPVPPLEVQHEMVRILDALTELESEMASNLAGEEAARQRQFAFYRESLLKFTEGEVRRVPLRELVSFTSGKPHERVVDPDGSVALMTSRFISTQGRAARYLQPLDVLSPAAADDIALVMSDLPNGRALARAFYVEANGRYAANQRVCLLRVTDPGVLSRFLYYLVDRNPQLLAFDNGRDQTHLSKAQILGIQMPVPELAEQQRVVSILDDFNSAGIGLSQHLHAELAARRKQYEHYRDRLLTFEEAA